MMQEKYNPHIVEYIISKLYDGKTRHLYPKTCEACGMLYYVPKQEQKRRRHCSVKCKGESRKNQIEIICDYCNKIIRRTPSKIAISKFNFCSRKCKELAQSLSGGPEFEELRPKHYKNGISYYREKAISHYGAKCNRCGYDKNIVALEVHHINCDRTNNYITNLEVLCANCHAIETRGIS